MSSLEGLIYMKNKLLSALLVLFFFVCLGAAGVMFASWWGSEEAMDSPSSEMALGEWTMYKMESSINSEGNKTLYEEELPAEWKIMMPTLTLKEATFEYYPYETRYSGTWNDGADLNREQFDWLKILAKPIGDIGGVFNVTKIYSEGAEYDATSEFWETDGNLLAFCYKAEADELVVIKDGGEGTDVTDYLYFKRASDNE